PRFRLGRQQLTLPAGPERLRLRRAAVPRLGGRGVAEADRHLERPALRRRELDPLADRAEAHAAVGSHLHPDVADALGARDAVLAVPELEGAVHLHELVCRRLGAEHVRPARGPDLDEHVLLERVHVSEPRLRQQRLELEPRGHTARAEESACHGHRERLRLHAAGRILEVGEAVAVVVDAVAADLARGRHGTSAESRGGGRGGAGGGWGGWRRGGGGGGAARGAGGAGGWSGGPAPRSGSWPRRGWWWSRRPVRWATWSCSRGRSRWWWRRRRGWWWSSGRASCSRWWSGRPPSWSRWSTTPGWWWSTRPARWSTWSCSRGRSRWWWRGGRRSWWWSARGWWWRPSAGR